MSDGSGSDDEFWNTIGEDVDQDSHEIIALSPGRSVRGRKRTAAQAGLSSDAEEVSANPSTHGSLTPATPSPAPRQGVNNRNLAAVARRFATQKKLRTEQARELEEFTTDTLTVQNIKLYGRLMALENRIEKIVVSQPPFEITKHLEENLTLYSNAVFYSSKLAAYKGSVALNHEITKRMRWGIPPGLEHNAAEWKKIKRKVQDIITQIRGAAKKEIKDSVSAADHLEHWDIFCLTEKLLRKNTRCKVTTPVMARVALWRNVFLKHQGENFWDKIDSRLRKLRKDCDTQEKLTRAFKRILKKDQDDHRERSDYRHLVDEDAISDVQLRVDEDIAAASRLMTSATNADDEEAVEVDDEAQDGETPGGCSARPSRRSSAGPAGGGEEHDGL
ncbi:hypothetical protein OH77DRAFT_1525888 [Trametes cingulata]|nr:hypothetical protein OH77DRAFT_1525888 [Trametes cingulata]